MRTRMDHHYTKPFTGIPALFHAIIHRALLDCTFIYPDDTSGLGITYLREVRILEEARIKAYAWLFTDGYREFHAIGRANVCDLAGLNIDYFEKLLPKIKDVIGHMQIHGEYEGCRPQEVVRWIGGMLIRNSQDEMVWQDVVAA